jgi:hypothetical protein
MTDLLRHPTDLSSPWSNDVVEFHARIDGGPVRVMVGRFAQTASRLLDAGEAGLSSLYFPGLRLSHYVKILRDDYGLLIETQREPHGGDYPGRHGRYRLHSRLDVVKVVRAIDGDGKRRSRRGKDGETAHAA